MEKSTEVLLCNFHKLFGGPRTLGADRVFINTQVAHFFPEILCSLTKKLFPEIIDNNHSICYNNTCQEGVAQEIQGRATLRK